MDAAVASGPRGSAVVTGAARGIGRAIAQEMVRRGYRVVISDLDAETVRRTAVEVGAVAGVGQDVRDERGHHLLAEEARRHGPLRVWVNNAGVGHDGPLAEQPSEHVSALVEVNFRGVVWGCRAAVAAMSTGSGGGDIVNVASLSGHGPVPGLSVYAATKAAVVSLTGSLDWELRPKGIRVHAVCPDGVDTALVASMDPGGQAAALVHSGGRLLAPEKVARATVDLVGSRRVVRTVPAWRGGMMRLAAMAPGVVVRVEPALRRQGRLRMRLRARRARR